MTRRNTLVRREPRDVEPGLEERLPILADELFGQWFAGEVAFRRVEGELSAAA